MPRDGGADLDVAARRLARQVERGVRRQERVGAFETNSRPRDLDARPRQLVDLVEERLGVDHHAVAEHAAHAGVEDAGGDQMEREVAVAEPDRVAGVVAALVAHHGVEGRAQEVDDLPLALVPPLHADDDDVGHDRIAIAAPATRRQER